MQVKDVMSRAVKTVNPTDSIQKAASIMHHIDCGAVPVIDGSTIVGMLTDRDIVMNAVASGKDPHTPVKDCMTHHIVTVEPHQEAQDAANLMADNQVRRLPVVEHDKLVGIVSIGDLARQNIYVTESGQALSDISKPSQHANAVH